MRFIFFYLIISSSSLNAAYICLEDNSVGFSSRSYQSKIYKPSQKYIFKKEGEHWYANSFSSDMANVLCRIENTKDIVSLTNHTDVIELVCESPGRDFFLNVTQLKFMYIHKAGYPTSFLSDSPFMSIGKCEKI